MKKKEHQKITRIILFFVSFMRVTWAQGQSCADLSCSGTCACRFIEVKFEDF